MAGDCQRCLHLGESGSITKGSVRVLTSSEKKGTTWDALEPSTRAWGKRGGEGQSVCGLRRKVVLALQ
jgi:hypothetical protein